MPHKKNCQIGSLLCQIVAVVLESSGIGAPITIHLDVELEKDLFLEEVFYIPSCLGAYALERSTGFADDDTLLAVALAVDDGGDANDIFLFDERIHLYLDGIRNLFVVVLEYLLADDLFEAIKATLPECPPFFPKDQLTDKSERFFVNEIIREKILQNYDKEIPYSVEVEVESFIEEEDIIRISAVIFCERDSQKGILIGKAGTALKRVGSQARKDIEDFLQKRVFLQLFVKVDRDWRSNTGRLRHYGYDLT